MFYYILTCYQNTPKPLLGIVSGGTASAISACRLGISMVLYVHFYCVISEVKHASTGCSGAVVFNRWSSSSSSWWQEVRFTKANWKLLECLVDTDKIPNYLNRLEIQHHHVVSFEFWKKMNPCRTTILKLLQDIFLCKDIESLVCDGIHAIIQGPTTTKSLSWPARAPRHHQWWGVLEP